MRTEFVDPATAACGVDGESVGPVNELTLSREDKGSATIRSLFLTALVNALSDLGSQIDPVLREYGFYRTQTATPYERVALNRYVSLLEHAAERFDRPFLGLEMGAQFGLEELGPFHALFTASDSLRACLESFVMFQNRWQSETMLDMQVEGHLTTLSYRILNPTVWPRRQDAEFTMAGIVLLIKQLATPMWHPVEVHFEHSIAGMEDHLSQFFKAPVAGNQVANQLVMCNEDLDRRFSRSNGLQGSRLKDVLETHLLDLLGPESTAAKGVVATAEEVIARRMGRAPVDCDSIAAELNLSPRSFRRRLLEEGTSFRNLLQEARQARAMTLLKSPDLPLSVVAERLGYSDTATFSRAFKEWTAVSPRRFSKNGT